MKGIDRIALAAVLAASLALSGCAGYIRNAMSDAELENSSTLSAEERQALVDSGKVSKFFTYCKGDIQLLEAFMQQLPKGAALAAAPAEPAAAAVASGSTDAEVIAAAYRPLFEGAVSQRVSHLEIWAWPSEEQLPLIAELQEQIVKEFADQETEWDFSYKFIISLDCSQAPEGFAEQLDAAFQLCLEEDSPFAAVALSVPEGSQLSLPELDAVLEQVDAAWQELPEEATIKEGLVPVEDDAEEADGAGDETDGVQGGDSAEAEGGAEDEAAGAEADSAAEGPRLGAASQDDSAAAEAEGEGASEASASEPAEGSADGDGSAETAASDEQPGLDGPSQPAMRLIWQVEPLLQAIAATDGEKALVVADILERGHPTQLTELASLYWQRDTLHDAQQMSANNVAVLVELPAANTLAPVNSPFALLRTSGVPVLLAGSEGIALTSNFVSAAYLYDLSYDDIKAMAYSSISHSGLSDEQVAACAESLDAAFTAFEARIADLADDFNWK